LIRKAIASCFVIILLPSVVVISKLQFVVVSWS